ncbi:MAG: tail fiber domain-containing protein, partial [Flavobacteriales bacterium]|nr:tail fiber domain-containing protein [Flavobacteriales bacterium]
TGTVTSIYGLQISSDVRIKKDLSISDKANDLALLNKIEITNYQLKDGGNNDKRNFKKAIAQQVAQIYPQAVYHSMSEVPDIYQSSTIESAWVKLSTNLRPGEMVLLLFGDEKELFEVLEVSETGFRVDSDRIGEVFVYGRQVDDFHSIDYDAISMLNVSATQEIASQLTSLQEKNQEQATRIEELEKQVADLEALTSRITRIETALNAKLD